MFNFLSTATLGLLFALPAVAIAQNSLATPGSDSVQRASAPTSFRSALEGYKNHTDEKTIDWKQANDSTGRIGGWREYAKEGQQSDAANSGTKPTLDKKSVKP